MPTSVSERLAAVRQALTDRDLTALIVTTGDPHMSEYLPENWALRRYLTGFTGSAGTLIVTADKALLWTDSRYWDQAARETAGTGITVMQAGKEDVPTPRAIAVRVKLKVFDAYVNPGLDEVGPLTLASVFRYT